MPKYTFDAPATQYGPYLPAAGGPGARFGWQSRASELWVQAGLVATGVAAGGLVILAPLAMGLRWSWHVPAIGASLLCLPALERPLSLALRPKNAPPPQDAGTRWPLWIPELAGVALALPALPVSWPWWTPLLGALTLAGLAFAGAALYLVRDDRRLLWAIAPAPEPSEPVAVVDSPYFVYCNNGPTQSTRPELATPEIPSPAERAREAYLRNLRFFIEHIYATGDATWETWQKVVMPTGDKLPRPLWREWCEMLVRTGLARRPYARATVQICSTYGDARRALRNVLTLPAGQASQEG